MNLKSKSDLKDEGLPFGRPNFVQHLVYFILFFLFPVGVFAGDLSNAEIAYKISGTWELSAKRGHLRFYQITRGLNVKIIGGGRKDKSGRLALQEDGTYLLRLDDEQIQRVSYLSESDELVVEHYDSRKDYERRLPYTWRTVAIRSKSNSSAG